MLRARDLIPACDVVLLTIDSLRYDVAVNALDAGDTPNLSALLPGGVWEERHTPGSFTFAAHQAFLAGFLGRETEPFAPAAAGADVPGARRERLVPARREHSTWVPCRAVGSNMLRGLAAADGLLAVPPGGLAAGDPCESLALPW